MAIIQLPNTSENGPFEKNTERHIQLRNKFLTLLQHIQNQIIEMLDISIVKLCNLSFNMSIETELERSGRLSKVRRIYANCTKRKPTWKTFNRNFDALCIRSIKNIDYSHFYDVKRNSNYVISYSFFSSRLATARRSTGRTRSCRWNQLAPDIYFRHRRKSIKCIN